MDYNNNNNNRVLRIPVFTSAAPPSPPMISFIAALCTTTLIYMCVYIFSPIVSVAILLSLYIATLFLSRVMHHRSELRARNYFHAQDCNQRVVRVFNKLFWVVEVKRGGKWQQVKKMMLGSVVYFGNQGMPSRSCVSECAICLEDYKKGEECLVFSVCGHTFHCDCIKHWLEEKLSCPICRYYMPSSSRGTELDLENLV